MFGTIRNAYCLIFQVNSLNVVRRKQEMVTLESYLTVSVLAHFSLNFQWQERVTVENMRLLKQLEHTPSFYNPK